MTEHNYNKEELRELGIVKIGKNVTISKRCSIYSKNIEIGDNVRIDDFCILSGNIILGSNIHISAYSALYGNYGIVIYDYSGLSPRTTLFSATDDFCGNYLVGSIHPDEFRNVISGKIIIRKYVQVGAGSVILPSVTLSEGSVIGSLSLVNSNTEEWSIYAGIPAKKIKDRQRGLLEYIKH